MPWIVLAVVGAAAILWWFSLHEDLFCLSVRDGRILVVRGRVPGRFVADVRDVLGRMGVRDATIRARPTEHSGRLEFSGDLDEFTQQRLRNVFGLIPAVQLRSAPPIARPTIGQRVGVAWLAWMFDRSAR
jgi:hypothetical protein